MHGIYVGKENTILLNGLRKTVETLKPDSGRRVLVALQMALSKTPNKAVPRHVKI
jgi:hypothetical protein